MHHLFFFNFYNLYWIIQFGFTSIFVQIPILIIKKKNNKKIETLREINSVIWIFEHFPISFLGKKKKKKTVNKIGDF